MISEPLDCGLCVQMALALELDWTSRLSKWGCTCTLSILSEAIG